MAIRMSNCCPLAKSSLESTNFNTTISSQETTTREIQKILSDDAKLYSLVVNYIVIAGTIAYFGIAGNIINIFIFTKQGFDNTMNISLTGIAVSDMCALIALVWFNILVNPLFENSDDVYIASETQYLTAGWPHCFFSRITCIITVFITMERCLCVTIPLKVKSVITKTRTKVVVVCIFISQFMTTIPTYYATYIDWKFFKERNRTMLGIYRITNFDEVEYISFVLQTLMQAGSLILLVFFTMILLVTMKRKTKWRKTNTSEMQKDNISTRDKRLVRMVVLIATILIVCFTPGMVCISAMAMEPEFTVGGAYDNVFYVAWSFTFICQTVNSSVNIFVYYNMSSKYRETFDQMFATCRKCLGLAEADS